MQLCITYKNDGRMTLIKVKQAIEMYYIIN